MALHERVKECHPSNLITSLQTSGRNRAAGKGPSWPGKTNVCYQKLVYFTNWPQLSGNTSLSLFQSPRVSSYHFKDPGACFLQGREPSAVGKHWLSIKGTVGLSDTEAFIWCFLSIPKASICPPPPPPGTGVDQGKGTKPRKGRR